VRSQIAEFEAIMDALTMCVLYLFRLPSSKHLLSSYLIILADLGSYGLPLPFYR
jgi:hypothetical protein